MVVPNQDSGGTRRACGSRNTDGWSGIRSRPKDIGLVASEAVQAIRAVTKGRKPVTSADGRVRATELHRVIVADCGGAVDESRLIE